MGSDAKVCASSATLVSTPKDLLIKGGTEKSKAVFYLCPNGDACSSTLVQADGSADCAKGFRGPLCALCRVGYAWSEGHKCTLCTGDTLGLLVGGGVGAGIVFMIAFYALLLHPIFERDGLGLAARVLARISRLGAYCRRSTAGESAETAASESTTSMGGMRRAMGTGDEGSNKEAR
jgi:hypothetical protein